MGSGLAFLDGSVIAVASLTLPMTSAADSATIQWVFDGYLLMLGALVLVGGSLGDLLGKRSVFIAGTAAFGVTSVLCGLAPTALILVVARMGQGAAAALVVPTSLALVNTLFGGADRGKAIGAWSGLAGCSLRSARLSVGYWWIPGPGLAVGLSDQHSTGHRCDHAGTDVDPERPRTRTSESLRSQVDVLGGLLAVGGLAFVVGPLIEIAKLGAWLTFVLVAIGLVLLALLVLVERRRERTLRPPPMVSAHPLSHSHVQRGQRRDVRGLRCAGISVLPRHDRASTGHGIHRRRCRAGRNPGDSDARALFIEGRWATSPPWGANVADSRSTDHGCRNGDAGMMRPGQSYWVGSSWLYDLRRRSGAGCRPGHGDGTCRRLREQIGYGIWVNNAVARIGSLIAIILLPLIGGLAASRAQGLQTGVDILDGYRTSMFAAAAICVFGAGLAGRIQPQ